MGGNKRSIVLMRGKVRRSSREKGCSGGSGLAGLRMLVSSEPSSESDIISARATIRAESACAMLWGSVTFWPEPVKTSTVTLVTVVLVVRMVMGGSEMAEKSQ